MYVWASDQARVAPGFLAVIDFNEDVENYGKYEDRAHPATGEHRQ